MEVKCAHLGNIVSSSFRPCTQCPIPLSVQMEKQEVSGQLWVQPGPHELEQHSGVSSPQGGKHPRWWGRRKGNRHVRRTEPNSFQPIRLKNIRTLKQMQKADLTIVKLYAKVFPKNIKRVYPINDLKYFVD